MMENNNADDDGDDGDALPALSPRERECLIYLARGLTIQAMTGVTGRSRKTLEKQIASARKKIGAATSEQAVAIAVSRRLL